MSSYRYNDGEIEELFATIAKLNNMAGVIKTSRERSGGAGVVAGAPTTIPTTIPTPITTPTTVPITTPTTVPITTLPTTIPTTAPRQIYKYPQSERSCICGVGSLTRKVQGDNSHYVCAQCDKRAN
jgi:hypothetical protein